MKNLRRSFFLIVNPSKSSKDPNFIFDAFIIVLIILNVVAIILQSEPELNQRFAIYFHWFEVFSVIIFSVEYITRLWTIVENQEYAHPIKGRILWMFSFMAMVDLLAILPFYLPFVGVDLRFLRIFRLFRVFRLLKIARYSSAIEIIVSVLKSKKEELLVTLMICSLLLILSASCMYYAERDAQPEMFRSIPTAMWWTLVNLTTVGWGDVVPVTAWGRFVGGIIAIMGIGLFALPTGILASGFSDELAKRRKNNNKD